ncbi:AAA family ATPase [Halomonas salifodinae]|uniref:AAA family ATPase n=1 Tax=Halomonas salifodinae TaxID=438745 RepID=UPI0033A1CF4F
MLEFLQINNFLVIKKASLEINDLNIIIGCQAQGKSIIAKLNYYFNKISEDFLEGVRKNLSKRELDKNLADKFESYFPRYAWEGSDFYVKYQLGGTSVLVEGRKSSKNKTSLKVTYSDDLVKLYASKRRVYRNALESFPVGEDDEYKFGFDEHAIFYEHVVAPIKNGVHSEFFGDAVFIPASRSFFANLQKNIFTFLASNLDIDPFIKEFGQIYESSKRIYLMRNLRNFRQTENKKVIAKLDDAIQSVIGGRYEYSKDQDWIVSKSRKINLANASSGQQEALPMFLLLYVWPFTMGRRGRGSAGKLFIEEPEAHLFPEAQSKIISIFSHLYNHPGSRFFITTHSPYILTAVNNLIMANDVIARGGVTKKSFQEKNKGGEPIRYEDVSAYTIQDGVLFNIKDDDFRMVGGDVLDSVSEGFEEIVDFLMSADSE